MNNKNEIYSFLNNYKPEEISDVIKDFRLITKGYKIIYVVDTYDIINYSLPFTSKNYLEGENQEKLSYQTIAYEALFGQNSNTNLILLDEYKAELLSIKNQIQKRFKNFPNIRREIIKILDEKGLINDSNNQNIEELLKNNLNIIIASLIFLEYGDNIYQRLINLLNEKLNIFNLYSGDIDIDEIVNNIFDEVRISDFSDSLYDTFVDKTILKLLSIESELDRAIYLENAYRDIAVIDRIIGVNDLVKKRHHEKKIVFIYLSSTPYKTNTLFELIKKNNYQLPDIDQYKSFNFSRNIFQCFLLHIILKNKKYFTKSSEIELLEFIEKEIKHTTSLASSSIKIKKASEIANEQNDNESLNILCQIISNYNKGVENSMIIDSYLEYRTKLQSGLNNLRSEKTKDELKKLFFKTDDYLNNTILSNSFATPLLNISNYKQSFFLSNSLQHNKDLFYRIKVPLGHDIIKNSFHHLPGLLFINDANDELSNSIFQFLYLILSPQKEISKLSTEFNKTIHIIINALSKYRKKSLYYLTQEFLALSLINLVTSSAKTFESTSSVTVLESEKEIIDVLKRQKAILKKSKLIPKIISDADGSFVINYETMGSSTPSIKEINYLLLWLLRRDNRIEDALKLGKECLKLYKGECRFHHGFALAHHAAAYDNYFNADEMDIKLILKHLKASKRNLITALRSYKKYLTKQDNEIVKKIVLKNIIAIRNTIADANLRIYILTEKKNTDLLDESNTHLKEMKNGFVEIEENFDNYPTINHTEAELYYLEALYYFENGEIQKAHLLILKSIAIINNFERNKDQVNDKFQLVISDINKLHIGIINKIK